MSWERTAVYCRRLNEQFRSHLGGPNSADIPMWSLNFDAIVSMQKKGRWDGPRHARADVAHADAQGGDCAVLGCTEICLLVGPEHRRSRARLNVAARLFGNRISHGEGNAT